MKIAVIYKSHYGSTQVYARWISEDLGADLIEATHIKPTDLQKYDTIVYGGGLYAGGVNGISVLTNNLEMIKNKSLYLFTVGVADVTNTENINAIRNGLEQKLPKALMEKLHIYHLRGGMYYSKMSFIHRTMMKMMIKMLSKKSESELSSDEKDIIDTVGVDTDFTDRTSITPLVADIKAGIKTQ